MNTRTVARLTFANPASAAYLTVVGGSIAVATSVNMFAADPGFIWVWPMLFTLPTSGLVASACVALAPEVGGTATTTFVMVGIAASGLVQSFVLGKLYDSVRIRLRGASRPHHG